MPRTPRASVSLSSILAPCGRALRILNGSALFLVGALALIVDALTKPRPVVVAEWPLDDLRDLTGG